MTSSLILLKVAKHNIKNYILSELSLLYWPNYCFLVNPTLNCCEFVPVCMSDVAEYTDGCEVIFSDVKSFENVLNVSEKLGGVTGVFDGTSHI